MLTLQKRPCRELHENASKALKLKVNAISVGSKYQITLPQEVRDALHLRPSDTLIFVIDGDSVYLRPQPESFTDSLRGLRKGICPDADAWLETLRAEWD